MGAPLRLPRSRFVPADADVLELGAGWCDFSNQVKARRVVAMDLDATVHKAAADHVEPVVGDSTDLSRFEDDSLRRRLRQQPARAPASASSPTRCSPTRRRVLRPGGRLILMQPNFRLNPGRYFDDFTHVAIFTDQSLSATTSSRRAGRSRRPCRGSCRSP